MKESPDDDDDDDDEDESDDDLDDDDDDDDGDDDDDLLPVDLRDSAGRGELRVGSDLERGAVATRSPRASDETPTASTEEPEEARDINPRLWSVACWL